MYFIIPKCWHQPALIYKRLRIAAFFNVELFKTVAVNMVNAMNAVNVPKSRAFHHAPNYKMFKLKFHRLWWQLLRNWTLTTTMPPPWLGSHPLLPQLQTWWLWITLWQLPLAETRRKTRRVPILSRLFTPRVRLVSTTNNILKFWKLFNLRRRVTNTRNQWHAQDLIGKTSGHQMATRHF